MPTHTSPSAPRLDRAGADEVGARFSAGLRARGIAPGDRVAFCAPNTPELLGAVFGCLLEGYAPVVLSAGLTVHERTSMLDDVDPAIVVDQDGLGSVLAAGAAGPAELGGWFACRPMHFTSGTSGRPKAVWSGWLDEDAANGLRDDEDAVWQFRSSDEHWVCSPLSHSAPLRFALHTLLAGGAVHVPAAFDEHALRTGIEQDLHSVTTTFMAPSQLQRLVALGPPSQHRLRFLAHAGAPCPEPVKRTAIEHFGAEVVVEFYGSTECQFTVCGADTWLQHPGTVGRPRPGRELRVVDGQLWCRPPSFARFTYWGDPEKTAQTWDGDWFTLGDLGRIDDAGLVHLEGRRTDLIISGGVNVYPAEVERILRELGGVADVCVVGLDDDRWGQRVVAVVVGDATTDEIDAFAREHLAPYKRPKEVHHVDAFPLTHSDKTDRRAVRASLESGSPTPT